ncbi:MAG: ABC transporter substrate-binding protein [Treponema sp.]|nr:ABC transporter substrate-binding protein [Treponema sp.]
MRFGKAIFLVGVACILFGGCSGKKDSTLKVYSIIHESETEVICDLFTKKTGIQVQYLRASTGELVNRLISEKDNPQADVLFGGATSYHLLARDAGALEPYVSPEAAGYPDYALSADGSYTGFCVLTLGIGYNTGRFAEKFPDVEVPRTWDDLLNERFKGEIVLTNPQASSTAYLFVQNQLQRLGMDGGWDYLSALAPLVGQFPDSGSAPAKLLGTGEYSIGVSYLHMMAKYKDQGFDVDYVAPPRSVGDVDCIAITRNAAHMEEAKKFVDFILSAEAQEVLSGLNYTIPANPRAKLKEGSITLDQIDLIDYDSKAAADQKSQVLARWAEVVD